jgi:hypothetical protein
MNGIPLQATIFKQKSQDQKNQSKSCFSVGILILGILVVKLEQMMMLEALWFALRLFM